jgi:homoserine kinase
MKEVKAFAPATVANVAVGFDILGFSISNVGDIVSVSKIKEKKVIIENITGVVKSLPHDPKKNTASVALIKMIKDLNLNFGFKISINKGIPLGSGMGGSAASAVGAVIAANALLDKPLNKQQLVEFALAGEMISSGDAHGDNIVPCIYGGLNLIKSMTPLDVIKIPVPKNIFCLLIHPHTKVSTAEARKLLKKEVDLKVHIKQSSYLAGFIAGCFSNDLDLIKRSMVDIIIEPQRSKLIPCFNKVKKLTAKERNVIGCSISGSGPSMFCWVNKKSNAVSLSKKLAKVFKDEGVMIDTYISSVNCSGAKLR